MWWQYAPLANFQETIFLDALASLDFNLSLTESVSDVFQIFSESSNTGEGRHKQYWYFLGIFPKPPPPLGTFRNQNVTFGQKKSGFQDQKTMATKI